MEENNELKDGAQLGAEQSATDSADNAHTDEVSQKLAALEAEKAAMLAEKQALLAEKAKRDAEIARKEKVIQQQQEARRKDKTYLKELEKSLAQGVVVAKESGVDLRVPEAPATDGMDMILEAIPDFEDIKDQMASVITEFNGAGIGAQFKSMPEVYAKDPYLTKIAAIARSRKGTTQETFNMSKEHEEAKAKEAAEAAKNEAAKKAKDAAAAGDSARPQSKSLSAKVNGLSWKQKDFRKTYDDIASQMR